MLRAGEDEQAGRAALPASLNGRAWRVCTLAFDSRGNTEAVFVVCLRTHCCRSYVARSSQLTFCLRLQSRGNDLFEQNWRMSFGRWLSELLRGFLDLPVKVVRIEWRRSLVRMGCVPLVVPQELFVGGLRRFSCLQRLTLRSCFVFSCFEGQRLSGI